MPTAQARIATRARRRDACPLGARRAGLLCVLSSAAADLPRRRVRRARVLRRGAQVRASARVRACQRASVGGCHFCSPFGSAAAASPEAVALTNVAQMLCRRVLRLLLLRMRVARHVSKLVPATCPSRHAGHQVLANTRRHARGDNDAARTRGNRYHAHLLPRERVRPRSRGAVCTAL